MDFLTYQKEIHIPQSTQDLPRLLDEASATAYLDLRLLGEWDRESLCRECRSLEREWDLEPALQEWEWDQLKGQATYQSYMYQNQYTRLSQFPNLDLEWEAF